MKVVRRLLPVCLTLALLTPVVAFARELTFQDRVDAQRAIERVYYSHQKGTDVLFEAAVPEGVLEGKVRTYLRQSLALDRFWHTPVTPQVLQREMERIAGSTRFPERLREIYTALGNDGFVIQECFARQVLVDRLSRSFFASDERIHGEREAFADRIPDESGTGETTKGPASGRSSISWDTWWAKNAAVFPESDVHAVAAEGAIPMPSVTYPKAVKSSLDAASGTCLSEDVWDNGILDDLPTTRTSGSAVWTGNVMIIWGGNFGGALNTGGRYDPLTDTWSPTSTVNAPSPRQVHSAVWTGSLMIVWGGAGSSGGGSEMNTGGRYDPLSDSWTPTSTLNAPSVRSSHSAVWTGSRMVVWGGGFNGSGSPDLLLNTGGRYDPVADAWEPTSTLDAPSPRIVQMAVWSGSSMVVWGGYDGAATYLNTGGRYDPDADVWVPTSTLDAPEGRSGHMMVWSGGRAIVWGGKNFQQVRLNTGGRYDPATDHWDSTSTLGAPTAREGATAAVSTGSEMIVYGGLGSQPVNNGARYNPSTDSWVAISTLNAPGPRGLSVWTGSQMIVWGRTFDPVVAEAASGGRYDPVSDSWTPTGEMNLAPTMTSASAVWTGNVMIVMGVRQSGGPGGSRYDPLLDAWTPVSSTGAYANPGQTAVWTGNQMIVWGGGSGFFPVPPPLTVPGSGARYDPISDLWSPVTTTGAAPRRHNHSAVWAGDRMIVWGGLDETVGALRSGGEYDPVADHWTVFTLSTQARFDHTAVWTGSRMLIWGGVASPNGSSPLNSGASYDPATHSGVALTTVGAPSPRRFHTAVWAGSRMIIWGGYDGTNTLGTGARYDPASDQWTPVSGVGAPAPLLSAPPIWTGTEMLIWRFPEIPGGRYNPDQDSWTPISPLNAPKDDLVAVWTGDMMVTWDWQGREGGRYLASVSVDADGDGFFCQGDCDDDNAAVHPGATEICNGIDDNCDGMVDENGSALCDDGNSCTVDACLGMAGCSNSTLSDGSMCSDGNACTQTDMCMGGVCMSGTPAICMPLDTCHQAGTCDPATGMCSNPVSPDGASCSDGVDCTSGETCAAGICSGGQPNAPPTVSVALNPPILTTANHQLVDVQATVIALDACGAPLSPILASVVSNEPDDAPGSTDGTTINDIQGASIGTMDFEFILRAERDRSRSGRIYTATFTAMDSAGHTGQGSGTVKVPLKKNSQPLPKNHNRQKELK